MRKIVLEINDDNYKYLSELAIKNYRTPAKQAAFLLNESLSKLIDDLEAQI